MTVYSDDLVTGQITGGAAEWFVGDWDFGVQQTGLEYREWEVL